MNVEYFALRYAGTEDEDWVLTTVKTDKVEFFGDWILFEANGRKVSIRCNELSIIYEDDNSAH